MFTTAFNTVKASEKREELNGANRLSLERKPTDRVTYLRALQT